jgi:hypothetical protein
MRLATLLDADTDHELAISRTAQRRHHAGSGPRN